MPHKCNGLCIDPRIYDYNFITIPVQLNQLVDMVKLQQSWFSVVIVSTLMSTMEANAPHSNAVINIGVWYDDPLS